MSTTRHRDRFGPARVMLLAFLIGMLLAVFAIPAPAQERPDGATARRSLEHTPHLVPSLVREVDSLRRALRELDAREAQLLKRRDSLRAELGLPPITDSLNPPPAKRAKGTRRIPFMTTASIDRPPNARAANVATLSVFSLGLVYNATCPFGARYCQRDAGGYTDEWLSEDKAIHATVAAGAVLAAHTAGAHPAVAAIGICAAGIAFEHTQGFVSHRDIAANCLGAGAAYLWARAWSS